MPIHTIEELDSSLPILCIYGEDHELVIPLIEKLIHKCKVILVADTQPNIPNAGKNFYFINTKDVTIVGKLQESIDYAVVFYKSPSDEMHVAQLLKKFSFDKTKSIFIFPALQLDVFENTIANLRDEKNFFVVAIGELLNAKSRLHQNEFATLISRTVEKEQITLAGNDLYPVYPISISDTIAGINKLLFSKISNSSLFNLFYSHPETLLSAVHLVGRAYPDVKIYFREGGELPARPSRGDFEKFVRNRLSLKCEYIDPVMEGFESSLSNLPVITNGESDDNEGEETSLPHTPQQGHQSRRKKSKNLAFTVLQILSATLFGILLFVFINIILFGIGLFLLKNSVKSFEKQEYSQISQKVTYAKLLLNLTQPTAYFSTVLLKNFDTEGQLLGTYNLINRTLSLTQLATKTINILESEKQLSKNDFESLLASIAYLFNEGERIKFEQNNKTLNSLLKQNQSHIISLFPVLSDLLGYEGKREYLILFQNNGELRPTGGFIGSVGELTITNGSIDDFKISDVYALDGQLTKHVEPPFVVRRFIQPHLYLRDSNFYADFQDSASKAAQIYNLETGKVPDGIIAVDFEVLKKALQTAGDLKLADGTKLDSGNAFDYIQGRIKKDFFPGSSQKKSALDDVFTQLLLKLESDKKAWFSFSLQIPDLLEQKHILVASRYPHLQGGMNANNFAGEMKDKRERESGTMYDFLSINEANIGVNKANIFVTRTLDYQIDLSGQNAMSKATIHIANDSEEQYKAYITLFVPKDSKIENIIIDGNKQRIVPAITDPKIYENKAFRPTLDQFEVETKSEYGFTAFSFITAVATNKNQMIEVTYQNGASRPLRALNPYSLQFVKQPGTSDLSFSFSLLFPSQYKPLDAMATSFGKDFVKFDDILTTDKEYNLSLQQK